MKKRRTITLIAGMLILSGCRVETSQTPPANNGGTQAVLSVEKESTPPDEPEPDSGSSAPAHGTLPIDSKNSDTIEIKEKMFIAQTNDIYLNVDDYLGKTIKYEGIFDQFTWEETGETYAYVIRYGPGCCGTDGNAGFEIIWDGDYPDKNDWVEVIGTLELYEENGYEYLRLRLSDLTVLPTRGAEYVSQ